jgi:uncharacterized membrane protein YGL010W
MAFLGFNFDLKDQLTFYGSYHNNPINQAIHFVFVPAILWTVAVRASPEIAGRSGALISIHASGSCLPCLRTGETLGLQIVPLMHTPAGVQVWLAYTPTLFSLDLLPLLPTCCAEYARSAPLRPYVTDTLVAIYGRVPGVARTTTRTQRLCLLLSHAQSTYLIRPHPPAFYPTPASPPCYNRRRYLVCNGSFVLLAAYASYYVLLEPLAGLSWAACMALPMWATANAVQQHVAAAWGWALGLHMLSWFAQVHFGHIMAEKRRPALLDSFFQVMRCAVLWFGCYHPCRPPPRVEAVVVLGCSS